MKLFDALRNFVSPTSWGRSSVVRTSVAERIRMRQEELLSSRRSIGSATVCDVDLGGDLDFFPQSKGRRLMVKHAPSESEPVSEPNPRTSFGKFDAKTLVLMVSLSVNGYIIGTGQAGKMAAVDEIRDLNGKVSQLEKERREVDGKILRPGQVAVPQETFNTVLAQSIASLERSLQAERENLARIEADMRSERTSVIKNPTSEPLLKMTERPSAEGSVLTAAPEISDVLSSANAELSKISGGSKLRAAKTGRGTVVLYSDDSGYRRFFTWENSENAARRSAEGLLDWAKTMNVESSLRNI